MYNVLSFLRKYRKINTERLLWTDGEEVFDRNSEDTYTHQQGAERSSLMFLAEAWA